MGRAERGSRVRAERRLKKQEKNFECNAGGEGEPMKLLCHKRDNVRETIKTSIVSITR